MKRRRCIHILLAGSVTILLRCHRLLGTVWPKPLTRAKPIANYPGKIQSLTENLFHTVGRWRG